MNPNATRGVLDAGQEAQHPEIKVLMQRIDAALPYLTAPAKPSLVGDALLNLALSHLLRERGVQETATALIRLIDAVLEFGERPSTDRAHARINPHSQPR